MKLSEPPVLRERRISISSGYQTPVEQTRLKQKIDQIKNKEDLLSSLYQEELLKYLGHQNLLGSDSNKGKSSEQATGSPCSQLSKLFKQNQVSSSFVRKLIQFQGGPVVIVSCLLPLHLMKKVLSSIGGFQAQCKYSEPGIPFFAELESHSTSSYKTLLLAIETSEVEQNNLKRDSLNVRKSSHSLRDTLLNGDKSSRQRNSINAPSSPKRNHQNSLIELAQIVLTSKSYIRQNFASFSQSAEEGVFPNQSSHHKITEELKLFKTLLFIDDEVEENTQVLSPPQLQRQKITSPFSKYKNSSDNINELSSEDNVGTISRETPSFNSNRVFVQLLEQSSLFSTVEQIPSNWIANEQELLQKSYRNQTQKEKPNKRSSNVSLLGIQRPRGDQEDQESPNVQQKCRPQVMAFLSQHCQSSLKQNLSFCRFCSSHLFLHFLSSLLKCSKSLSSNEKISYREERVESFGLYSLLLQKSLQSFFAETELNYLLKVEQSCKQVMNEFQLRNILRNIKKDIVVWTKRNLQYVPLPRALKPINPNFFSRDHFDNHLSMAGAANSQAVSSVDQQYLSDFEFQIMAMIEKEDEEIYFQNNSRAEQINRKILEDEYERIVGEGLYREKIKKKESAVSIESSESIPSEKHIKENRFSDSFKARPKQLNINDVKNRLKADFEKFMQAYLQKGIKVSSQLKSFNQIMEDKKADYIKAVNSLVKDRQGTKRRQQQIREENHRSLKLLEIEIARLEEKRKEVKSKNDLIQQKIAEEENGTIDSRFKAGNQKSMSKSKSSKSERQKSLTALSALKRSESEGREKVDRNQFHKSKSHYHNADEVKQGTQRPIAIQLTSMNNQLTFKRSQTANQESNGYGQGRSNQEKFVRPDQTSKKLSRKQRIEIEDKKRRRFCGGKCCEIM